MRELRQRREQTVSDVRILPRTRTTWHKNSVSGHEWPEYETLSGYEVHGGFFQATRHTTLKSAETEAEVRRSINKKFPWKPPLSAKGV